MSADATAGGLTEPAVTRELMTALREKRPPQFERAPTATWVRSINEAFRKGELDMGMHALKALNRREPDLAWATNMRKLMASTPRPQGVARTFRDDERAPIQICAHPGADTVVFVFCGVQHIPGVPIPLLQPWFSALGVSAVYIRDFSRSAFLNGVPPLGKDRAETIKGLKRIAAQLGATHSLCMGGSIGGFAALIYGLEMEAERVLCFTPATNMEPEFNTFLNRRDSSLKLKAKDPQGPLDVRGLYLGAKRTPPAILIFGDSNWDDRLQAENMMGLPGVSLRSIKDYDGHGCINLLIVRRLFERILRTFFKAPA